MSQRKIAIYITHSSLTPQLLASLQHTFDTYIDHGPSPQPGFIVPPPDADWALGMAPNNVWQRHRQSNTQQYVARPIVVLDEQTAADKSVLLVSPFINEKTDDWEFKALRFVPEKVPSAAINLSIGNQSLVELEYHIDDDGIWRQFKTR